MKTLKSYGDCGGLLGVHKTDVLIETLLRNGTETKTRFDLEGKDGSNLGEVANALNCSASFYYNKCEDLVSMDNNMETRLRITIDRGPQRLMNEFRLGASELGEALLDIYNILNQIK